MPYKDPDKERACGRRRYERITAERTARGMCPRCGRARPAPDRNLCRHCGEKRRKAERAKKGRGKDSREIVSLHRSADEARARRDHHLHGRQLHHPRRSILGGSRDGLVRERQVSLTCGRRGRPAGRPSSGLQPRKEGTCHTKIPIKNARAGGGGMNALPPSGLPAACVRGAEGRGLRPIGTCAGIAAKSVARPSAQDARRPRRLAYHTAAETRNSLVCA